MKNLTFTVWVGDGDGEREGGQQWRCGRGGAVDGDVEQKGGEGWRRAEGRLAVTVTARQRMDNVGVTERTDGDDSEQVSGKADAM